MTFYTVKKLTVCWQPLFMPYSFFNFHVFYSVLKVHLRLKSLINTHISYGTSIKDTVPFAANIKFCRALQEL